MGFKRSIINFMARFNLLDTKIRKRWSITNNLKLNICKIDSSFRFSSVYLSVLYISSGVLF